MANVIAALEAFVDNEPRRALDAQDRVSQIVARRALGKTGRAVPHPHPGESFIDRLARHHPFLYIKAMSG